MYLLKSIGIVKLNSSTLPITKNDTIDMIICNLVSQIHISFSKNSSFAMYYDSKTF